MKKTSKKQSRSEQIKELQASISSKVATLTSSEEWLKMLQFFAQFHDYSARNVMLIYAQLPTATKVAGYKKWQEMGRQVRKGSKALKILGIQTGVRKDDAGNVITDSNGVEETYTYYPVLSVFDVSQTDPIDGVEDVYAEKTKVLDQTIQGVDTHMVFAKLRTVIENSGWTVRKGATFSESMKGYTQHANKLIVVQDSMSDAQCANTIIHECAHMLLHANDAAYEDNREQCEVEAESVAYVLGQMYGIDNTQKSTSYIAGWAASDTTLIERTASTVFTTAVRIDKAIRGEITKF